MAYPGYGEIFKITINFYKVFKKLSFFFIIEFFKEYAVFTALNIVTKTKSGAENLN